MVVLATLGQAALEVDAILPDDAGKAKLPKPNRRRDVLPGGAVVDFLTDALADVEDGELEGIRRVGRIGAEVGDRRLRVQPRIG